MNNLIDGTITDFDEGDLVNGTVVKIEHDEVLVDIGFKSEGVIPVRELSIRKDANPADIVALGDPIEALVLQKEDKDGRLVLSKKRAEYERAWNRIEEKFNSGENVEGEVIEVVKGGLILDIGLRGFLPASLVDLRRVKDLTSYMGTRIEARVIEMDRNRNNVVLSRRVVLEESRKAERSEILSKLKSGMRLQGTVSSIVDFGAFVDLGGIDGLVHISELANRHVENPETVVKPGETVFVKVIDVDLDRRRISLSLKQANDSVDPASEDFDPAIYGMPAEYDEQGNYKYPEASTRTPTSGSLVTRSSARSGSLSTPPLTSCGRSTRSSWPRSWRTLPNPQPPTARARRKRSRSRRPPTTLPLLRLPVPSPTPISSPPCATSCSASEFAAKLALSV